MKAYLIFIRRNQICDESSYDFQRDLFEDTDGPFDQRTLYDEECLLYAVSDNQDLVERFLSFRNRKKFFLAIKKMSRENYQRFLSSHTELILKEDFISIGDDETTVVLTTYELDFYQSMYDALDSEIEEVEEYRYPMDIIINLVKSKYRKDIINSGICNVIKMLDGMETGEPFWLEPNFQKFLICYFGFTL